LNDIRAAHTAGIESMTFVGDSRKDIEAALAGGCQPVLVLTGNGRQTQEELAEDWPTIPVFDDLASFVDSKTSKISSDD
jgi:D-glycero-D-manno-heptose 1,7-bisphosphate phosphatase